MSAAQTPGTPAVTETAAHATPAAAAELGIDMDAFSAVLNLAPDKPKAAPAAEAKPEAGKTTKEPEHLAAANGRKPPVKEPLDPLNEQDFDAEKLKTPEALKAAAERIQKARRQALELTRASHRAHAAAEQRERKIVARETGVG